MGAGRLLHERPSIRQVEDAHGFRDIDIPYFHEQGFVRKVCQVTNLWFWTRDPSREPLGTPRKMSTLSSEIPSFLVTTNVERR